MRESAILFACAAVLAVGVLSPGCGSSGDSKKRDGGLAGAMGTGGGSGTGGQGSGGVLGTGGGGGSGGGPRTGGVSGSGGATGADAGSAWDAVGDGTLTKLDANVDRSDADNRDVAIEGVTMDGGFSIDLGVLDTADDKPDAETAAPACAAAGGSCSPSRWQTCPAHYEPIDQGTGHLDCANYGWCCIPAPSSPCSDQNSGDCVVGDTCTGCWAPAPNTPACETGRVCCIDMCD